MSVEEEKTLLLFLALGVIGCVFSVSVCTLLFSPRPRTDLASAGHLVNTDEVRVGMRSVSEAPGEKIRE